MYFISAWVYIWLHHRWLELNMDLEEAQFFGHFEWFQPILVSLGLLGS